MTTAESTNYYELLGVERAATKEQIRDAYKELARIYHPDSHFYDEILEEAKMEASSESNTFKLITLAYNTLSNEKSRKEYDDAMPADLPTWEANQADNWHVNHRMATSPASGNESRTTSNAYGNFGTNQRPAPAHMRPRKPTGRSAFDEEQLRNIRPVSEMIKRKKGPWYKLKWLFFLEK